MRRFLCWFLFYAQLSYGAACVNGVQASPYADITADCHVIWSSFLAFAGNEGNAYDLYYKTADGLNASNLKPIEVKIHGGGFQATAASQAQAWTKYYAQRAEDGVIEVVPDYTVSNMYQLSATLNPGDTTVTITNPIYAILGNTCAPLWTPTGQTGVVMNIGTDTVTVTGAFPACDGAAHTLAVTRLNSGSTQANSTYAYFQGNGWFPSGNDIVGFLSYLAHCAPGGSSYNAGTCAGKTNIVGDPKHMRSWFDSAGGQLMNLLFVKYNCYDGPHCTLGVGVHEYTDTGWAFSNPGWTVPAVGVSVASNTGRIYAQNTITGTGSADTTAATILMNGLGIPACPPGDTSTFSLVTLVCTNSSTIYTASNLWDVLSLMQAGGTMPLLELEQSGTTDPDFSVWEPLLGQQQGFLAHAYAGLGHEIDYLGGHTPATSTGFKELQAVLGKNDCQGSAPNTGMCPVSNPLPGSGVF